MITPEEVKSLIGEVFHVHEINGLISVVTPFLYPDNDNIEVYINKKHSLLQVSDLGEVLSRSRISERKIGNLNEICAEFGIKSERGELTKLIDTSHLIYGITDMISAILLLTRS